MTDSINQRDWQKDWMARDRECLWHPYTQMQTAPAPLPVVRGEGVYLYTADGRRLLDGISSWWVNIHGHSHPALNAALAAQASILEHVMFAGCTHPGAVELAERLLELLPPGLARIFYSDNGSTAVEVALKMAWQYWRNRGEDGRRTFIVLHYAYHGDTVGAMSASEDSLFTQPFTPLLFRVARADAPYCYRCPLGLQRAACRIDCLESLERLLREEGPQVAGVLIEPMLQGAGGMIVWPPEFLAGVRRLCDSYGTLMIADEVLTGFGRTGPMFACRHASISPDIICLSKALTAGYLPMGVTATTEAVYRAFLSDDRSRAFFHGHSFTANPLGCAVALASLELFRTESVLERIEALERRLRGRLEPLAVLPHVGEVRVLGGVGIVELVQDRATRSAGGYLDRVGPQLAAEFLRRGLLLRPLGNVLYFMPPYVISESETDWALTQIAEVLESWRWPGT
ncbi:MAG TPA: adenosylmethionine--8-amino-7-oxononanoate transaminase [Blastocatellia bacterium]|nr:adenosylmethionine--8-amino-7-oxononanoate transaminase [Blastocatellia bacterium]